jgi:hypothetical protein
MKSRFLKSETFAALITIVLLTIITHGLRLATLGYYRDDWYLIWNGHTRGFESIALIFQGDRPFMGIVYAWEYLFLGDNPLNWHIYAFVLKLSGVLAFFWLLRMIWPKRILATTAGVLLFTVYPGFLQQPNANTFQNHLFGYFIGILSIALTIKAIQTSGRWKVISLNAIAILFQLIYLNIYEYMIGLEGVRFILIWYITFRDSDAPFWTNFKIVLKRGLIFIPALAGVLYWRVFIFESNRNAMNMDSLLSSYASSGLRGWFYRITDFLVDTFESIVAAWTVPLYGFLQEVTYQEIGIAFLTAMLASSLFFVYYLIHKRQNLFCEDPETAKKSSAFIWIGLLATFSTILPIILAGRTIYFSSQFDRYTLQATIGISLFLIGLIFYGVRLKLRVYVLLFLVVLGVATHSLNITFHQELWHLQKELWWQLSWRAPDIKDDTVLMAVLPPKYRLAESYEIWGPSNLIYRPESNTVKIPAEVLNSDTAYNILRGTSDERSQRGGELIRDFDNVLILTMPTAQNCVNAIDGSKYELSQAEDLLVAQIAPHSQIDRIDTESSFHVPLSSVFGTEPDHTWCYYYQKMSLARQIGDWQEVARIADEGLDGGYKPLDLSEWMPVFEGYANVGRTKDARQIASILRSDKNLQFSICSQLENWSEYPVDYNYEFIYGELCLKK